MPVAWEGCLLSGNKDEFSYCNIYKWHEAGYKGKGIKAAVFEDTSYGHGRMVADILKQVMPEGEILSRPRPGPIETTGGRLSPDSRSRLIAFYNGLVEEGVCIIVQSLGGTGGEEIEQLEKELLVDKGLVLFTSAGNSNEPISPGTSAYLSTWIAVGACVLVNSKPRRTSYSNYGPRLDVMGFTNLTTTWGGVFDGTSCANPFVAGLCGLWFQWFKEHYHRTPNQEETLAFIRQNSEDLGNPGFDDMYAYGLLRLPDLATLVKGELDMDMTVRVCLDPGHGGPDPGAVGPRGLKEKDVNLAVAKRIAYHLQRHDIAVKLTREDDREVDLADRCRISNDFEADVFLSIHCNAADNADANGTESWYCTSNGLFVARKVQEAVVASIGRANRGCKSMGFYVLRYTKAPAALLEIAFISNPEEEKLLATPEFQERVAQGAAKGILAYLGAAWKEPPQENNKPISRGKTVIRLKIGEKQMLRNDGRVIALDVPARLENGRTLVPLRAIAEALGATVNYDAKTQEITIAL